MPPSARPRRAQNFGVAMGVLRDATPTWSTAFATGWSRSPSTVPDRVDGFSLGGRGADIFDDQRLYDCQAYPAALWKQPGEKAPNRAALATWGAWVNAFAKPEYGRPLFIACSADLAESTNIAGFAKDFGEHARLGLVRPRHQPARHPAAAGDHRVHQRRHQRGHRHRQPGR